MDSLKYVNLANSNKLDYIINRVGLVNFSGDLDIQSSGNRSDDRTSIAAAALGKSIGFIVSGIDRMPVVEYKLNDTTIRHDYGINLDEAA
jgi:hypothetical protein